MIWCFGFFLWLQCDCDEEPHQRCEALQMLTLVTKTVQRPDNIYCKQSTHDIFLRLAFWLAQKMRLTNQRTESWSTTPAILRMLNLFRIRIRCHIEVRYLNCVRGITLKTIICHTYIKREVALSTPSNFPEKLSELIYLLYHWFSRVDT